MLQSKVILVTIWVNKIRSIRDHLCSSFNKWVFFIFDLAVDAYGNVTCDSKERNDNCRFIITICAMSIGKDNGNFGYLLSHDISYDR